MILYNNDFLKMDLQPSQRLLEVTWPNFEGYSIEDGKLTMTRIINAIKEYDVLRLLIDASVTKLELELIEYHDLAKFFMEELFKTNVKKVARLITTDQNREQLVLHLTGSQPLPLDFQNFTNREEALNWLLETGKS